MTTQPEPSQDQQEATTPAPTPEGSEASQGSTAAPSDDHGGNSTDELARVRHEAAQRRVQLREAEQALAALRGQVVELQRDRIESMVSDRLRDPADLWKADGIDLASLLDDDGGVDVEKVDRAVRSAIEAKPHWARQVDFGAGVRTEHVSRACRRPGPFRMLGTAFPVRGIHKPASVGSG